MFFVLRYLFSLGLVLWTAGASGAGGAGRPLPADDGGPLVVPLARAAVQLGPAAGTGAQQGARRAIAADGRCCSVARQVPLQDVASRLA